MLSVECCLTDPIDFVGWDPLWERALVLKHGWDGRGGKGENSAVQEVTESHGQDGEDLNRESGAPNEDEFQSQVATLKEDKRYSCEANTTSVHLSIIAQWDQYCRLKTCLKTHVHMPQLCMYVRRYFL